MIPIPQPSVISRQQLPASLHVDASRAFRLSKLLLRRLNGFPRFLKPCRTQDSDADVRRRAYYQQLLLEFMPGLLLRRYNGFPRFLKPCRTLDSDASRCTFRSDSDASEQRNSALSASHFARPAPSSSSSCRIVSASSPRQPLLNPAQLLPSIT